MEFENEPTDEQLDQLLRNVVIPPDLKTRLKQLPSQQKFNRPQADPGITTHEASGRSNTSWMTFVLAASLIGIGLFVAFQFWPTTDNGGVPLEKIANNVEPQTEIEVKSPDADEFENGLAEFLQGQEHLEAAIHAIEIAQMDAQLAKLEQTAAVRLDQHEVESMIAAMSEQYSIPLGMPEPQAKSRMAQVIKQYPGTRGAKIAHEFLELDNN